MLWYNYRAFYQLIIIFLFVFITLTACKEDKATDNVKPSPSVSVEKEKKEEPKKEKAGPEEEKEKEEDEDVNNDLSPVKTAIDKFKHKPVDNYNDEYDTHFRKASKKYFGVGFDYRWFKSQGMAESRLDPDAVSPVGAKGIMQVMDPTYKEVKRKNKAVLGNVFEARWNIEAGVYYDSYLYGQWSSPRPELDRLSLMFASYNAGLGNILKSQKSCNRLTELNCNLWNNIKAQGELISSWKQEETIPYVTRIFKFMGNKDYQK